MADTAQRMTVLQIIEKASAPGSDPQRTYAAILQMSEQPNYRLFRHQNTLLFIDNQIPVWRFPFRRWNYSNRVKKHKINVA